MDVENNAAAKRLDLTPTSEIKIVNPNLEHVHRDTIGGRNFSFEPMVIYQVEEDRGDFLVTRADDLYRNQVAGSRAEMHNYLSLIESLEPQKRAMASIFCTVNEHGTPIPKSQPPPKVGLVRLDSTEGRRTYEESLAELKAISQAKPEKQVVVEHVVEEQQSQEEYVTLTAPDMNWEVDLKISYIKEFAPRKKVYTNWKNNINGLNKQLMDSFNDRKKSFEDLGIKYRVSTDYKPKEQGG